MNTVNIIGRLTKDPEIRETKNGSSVCDFRLAIDDTFSRDDRADFINVTVFDRQAELCALHLAKGMYAGVSGRIRTDTYTDDEGIKRYPVKVIGSYVKFVQYREDMVEREAETVVEIVPDEDEDETEIEPVNEGDAEEEGEYDDEDDAEDEDDYGDDETDDEDYDEDEDEYGDEDETEDYDEE